MSHTESIEANKKAFKQFVEEEKQHTYIEVLLDTVAYFLVTHNVEDTRSEELDNETPTEGELLLKRFSDLEKGKLVGDLLKPDSKIVDFACGTGAIAQRLAPFVPQGEYVGIDISEDMLKRFGETAASLKPEWPNFKMSSICSDILAPGFDDSTLVGSADVVFSSMAFHHLHDYNKIAQKLKTFLKPGGHFVVIDMYSDPSKGHHSLLSSHHHAHSHSHEHHHHHHHHHHEHNESHEKHEKHSDISEEAVKHGVSHHGISNEEMKKCLSPGCTNVLSRREFNATLWFDKNLVDPDGSRGLPVQDGMAKAPCSLIVGVAQKA